MEQAVIALAYFSLKIQTNGIPVVNTVCHLGAEHLVSHLSGYGMLFSIPGVGGEGRAVIFQKSKCK